MTSDISLSKGNIPTVCNWIHKRQTELGISDESLASALGYSKPAVITLMKNGTMRFPINKVAALANALSAGQVEMLGILLNDYSPELWAVIKQAVPVGDMSISEVNLVRHVRRLANGNESSTLVFEGAGVIALVAVQ